MGSAPMASLPAVPSASTWWRTRWRRRWKYRGLNGYAILVEGAPGAVIERNVVTNRSFGPGVSFGIRISTSASKVHVVGNRIANMRNGIYFYPGATGLYMDNTVTGATAPFTGGTAAGATNFSF